MPNYTLSSTLIEALYSAAQELCTRRLRHAETGFPLTADQVQRMILPAKWRASILEMKAEKLEFLSNNYLNVDFIKAVVGIRRVGGHFIYVYVNYQQSFDASALPSHTIDELNKWLDNAIIEKKMADLSVKTINAFLKNGYGATAGHITVRWPGLKLLVSNSMADRYFRNTISGWKQKFADPPKRLSMYGWDRDPKAMEFYKKYAKAMRLADMVMATGQMLPKEITDSGELKASIYSLAE